MINPLTSYDGIIVLSYGGPRSHDDVLPFMRNATRGRGVPDSRLAEVSVHYKKFDGVSPINARNEELVQALQVSLKAKGSDIPIYLGNRNWTPFIVDVLREAYDEGKRDFIFMTTSAYSSYSGCRQYREDLAEAVQILESEGRVGMTFKKVPHYYDAEGLIYANANAVIDSIREASAAQAPEDGSEDEEPTVVFVTHSVPIEMSEASGALPYVSAYEAQHDEHYRRVIALVNDWHGREVKWTNAYCSRSGSPHQPWQEPDINDLLEDLHEDGVRKVVVMPAGFLCDHMEVVWDLDTEAAQTAQDLGMVYRRARTPGTNPAFIDSLSDRIIEAARAKDTSCYMDCCKANVAYQVLPAIG